jgi:hypothetical protein
MQSSNQSRFIFALMLTLIILSPCVTSVSNTNFALSPSSTMELAAPTISGLTFYEFENGSSGETLEYDAFDADPLNYSVTVDGSDYDSGLWDGDSITVYLVYLYTMDLINSLPQDFIFVVPVTYIQSININHNVVTIPISSFQNRGVSPRFIGYP